MNNRAATLKRPYRWITLTSFTLLIVVSFSLSYTFPPLIGFLHKQYGVTKLTASYLVSVFPLCYLVIAIPAGRVIDRFGYKKVISAVSLLTSICACVRIYTESFWIILLGQFGIAVAQAFLSTSMSKVAADWFSKEEDGLATGIITMGFFLGCTIGLSISVPLTQDLGFRQAMIVFAVAAIIVTIISLLFIKQNTLDPESYRKEHKNTIADIVLLFKNRNLFLIFVINFVTFGLSSGLLTWLESMLAFNGVSAEDAGLIGGTLLIGGIIGSVVLLALSDKFQNRKAFLIITVIPALLVVYPLCSYSNLSLLYSMSFIFGFSFLPGFAVILIISETLAGERLIGLSTGILFFLGHLGSFLTIVAMELVRGADGDWQNAIFLVIVLLIVALIPCFMFSEKALKEKEVMEA